MEQREKGLSYALARVPGDGPGDVVEEISMARRHGLHRE